MNAPLSHALLLSALSAGPLTATPHAAPLRVPQGDPHPEQWFEHSTINQREEMSRRVSTRSSQAQELAALVLRGDEDAYCELAVRNREHRECLERLCEQAGPEQRALLDPLLAYHRLELERPSFRDEERFGQPRSHFILALRAVRQCEGPQARREALHRLLEREKDLHRVELLFIEAALRQWCGTRHDKLLQKRVVQSFAKEFRPGRPVAADDDMRCNIRYSYSYLNDFLLAEAGVNGDNYSLSETPGEQAWRALWLYPEEAVALAEGLGLHAFSLLRMNSEGLERYAAHVGKKEVPAPLPHASRATQNSSAVLGLCFLREQLAAGQHAAAAQILALSEADSTINTTPACRTARSLLLAQSRPAEAERLRRDALLLALLRRDTEPELLYAYVDDLLQHGTKEDLALAQRVSLWCGAFPVSRAMAERYAALGCRAEAAFCCEALLRFNIARGSEADALRRLRDACGAAPDKAAEEGRESAAEPPSPFRAESRDWALKDGSSLRGELRAIYPTLGFMRLQAADGSLRDIRLSELAEDPAAIFAQWKADNGIREWKWTYRGPCYRHDLRGKLLSACADLAHPGHYLYTVVDESLCINRGESWGLDADKRALIAAHYREHGSARPCGDPLVAADLAEARRLSAEKGVPVMLFFTAAPGKHSLPNSAMAELENQLVLHPEDAARWRESMVILPVFLTDDSGHNRSGYPEAQMEELRAFERELHPGTSDEHSLITAATTPDRYGCRPHWVCPERGLILKGELPPQLPENPEAGSSPHEL